MIRARAICCLLTLCSAPCVIDAGEESLSLMPGTGRDLVLSNCLACHSADYIVMNTGIQGKSGWAATVKKMIDVMNAPISPADAERIVSYLAQNYGNGS